jgi:hypothetical protein
VGNTGQNRRLLRWWRGWLARAFVWDSLATIMTVKLTKNFPAVIVAFHFGTGLISWKCWKVVRLRKFGVLAASMFFDLNSP